MSRRVAVVASIVVVVAAFVVYSLYDVPRLDNNLMGDVERAGWVGALAARLGAGARLYDTLVVAMPPGALLVMRAIQRVVGRPLLVEELVLVQVARLALAFVAWSIARPLGSRRTGILVLVGTLAVVSQLPRESADEVLAALCAWGSLATGVRALLAAPGAARSRGFALTGALAALALAFETSTGVGAVSTWLLALVLWSRADVKAWLAGAAAGVGALLGLVLAAGASPAGYLRAVVADGLALHGGATGLGKTLLAEAFLAPALSASLVLVVAVVAVGFRTAGARDADAPASPAAPLAAALAFGVATLLLARGAHLPRVVGAVCTALAVTPAFGLVLAFVRLAAPDAERALAWKTLVVVAVGVTVTHGFAYPSLAPVAQYGPAIPVGVLALFSALERTRWRFVSGAALALLLAVPFGLRLDRAADARIAAGARGNWAGLSVGVRGGEILRLARRVQQLAAPGDTVLVLPDDPELAALVDRPRPPIRGAIVFAGEYPARLAAGDIATLDAHPPRVVIALPRSADKWRKLFHLLGHGAGARRVVDHVERDLLPRLYRRDSSYRCLYFFDQGVIDVWVRR